MNDSEFTTEGGKAAQLSMYLPTISIFGLMVSFAPNSKDLEIGDLLKLD